MKRTEDGIVRIGEGGVMRVSALVEGHLAGALHPADRLDLVVNVHTEWRRREIRGGGEVLGNRVVGSGDRDREGGGSSRCRVL